MTIDVAVVGLNFGAEFAPIYASHPDVGRVAVVELDERRRDEFADQYGMDARYTSLDELLVTDEWDAVHLTTPVPMHARHTLAVLRSGRHCACAVPMALALDDVAEIVAAQRQTGRTYMMMETSVFAREYFYARDLYERGELGDLTFFRGVHIQNLDGFPPYWMGYPPMAYLTHALSPALALTGARVEKVHCLGSGQLTEQQSGDFDNPFPLETGVFRLDRDGLAAEITMSFFQTARTYQEGFSVYGTAAGVEWPAFEDEPVITFRLQPLVPGHRGRPVRAERVAPPDRADLLPQSIAHFTRPTSYQPRTGGTAIAMGSAHGGSHPHLVHEFVRSIVEQRPPLVEAMTAADWTAPGLCAHTSAMHGGDAVAVPRFGP